MTGVGRSKVAFRLDRRAAGILLHPTSLPGPHGIGDLGREANRFVDFLHAAGQTWWQMLPTGPVGPGNSPYSGLSTFAGNPLLINLERLADEGLLRRCDLRPIRGLDAERVKYGVVARFKLARLRRAFDEFAGGGGLRRQDFVRFCTNNAGWLEDDALFAALRATRRGQGWAQWKPDLRARRKAALGEAAEALRDEIRFQRFVQYQFDRQWAALREYAHQRGVGLIGDIPVFVAHDSADVWAHQDLFDLDASGRAKTVSGVPPDYFSETGQLWGHPHYRWERHRATRFAWWVARFKRMFEHFDALRIDHFLGFHQVWVVSGRARTAAHGKYKRTPGRELFAELRRELGRLEIIAEDLGAITPEALALRERLGFPGMRVLHFAFGNDEGDRYNQPHTYPRNCVVYPGTHDNDTTVGWFEKLKRAHRQRGRTGPMTPYRRVLRYLGTDGREIHWDMIRLALRSVANTAIIPLQDVLGLDSRARMNLPATPRGNWEWRFTRRQLTAQLAARLRELVEAYGRAP